MFESLAAPEHSKRIHILNIDFDPPGDPFPPGEDGVLALGSCRFFTLSFPQLTSLGWGGSGKYTNHMFSISPFAPTVRYPSFEGSWDGSLMQVNNLTSFAFTNHKDNVCVKTLRLFMLNNRSIESRTLEVDAFEGGVKGPLLTFSTSSHSV